MHQRILTAFGGTHEACLAVEEVAALARAFSSRVRVVWTIGSLTMPESREIYSVDKLREEIHYTASASLIELQRQFDADGIPAEIGILTLDTTDDDIGNALEHGAEYWQADTIIVGSQGKHGLARLLLDGVAERAMRLSHRTIIMVRAQHPQHTAGWGRIAPLCSLLHREN